MINNDNSFIWKEEYSVGIHEIDKQHKEIFTLVNDLSQLCAIDDTKSYGTFKIMLSSAMEYFENHFWEEEKYMQEKNYPMYSEHKNEHGTMLREIKEMAVKIGKDETITINIITSYLKEWYMAHFFGADKEMGDYFRKVVNPACSGT